MEETLVAVGARWRGAPTSLIVALFFLIHPLPRRFFFKDTFL
jgi:hypothetical protein